MTPRIALAQIDPVLGDLARNAEKHAEAAERARAAGAALVVFPELSLSGYGVKDLHWDLAVRTADPPAALRPLLEASRGVSVLAGSVEEGPDFGLYNAALLFENGSVRTVHRPTQSLNSVSYGKERPIATGHDEASWAKNRRAHFVVKY